LAEAHNALGLAYANKEQNDEAIAEFNKAIKLKPDYEMAFWSRGLAYVGLKQFDQAIKDANKAIGLKPDFAVAYNLRALAYFALLIFVMLM
jgi:tetratricopeptide (TPR) repeat protein